MFLYACTVLNLLRRGGDDAHIGAGDELAGKVDSFLLLELDDTVSHSEEGVIGAALDVFTRVKLGAALADDNIAGLDFLIAVDFDTETLGNGIAA